MRIAVLVSGSGSNLQSIIDAERSDETFGAKTVVVIADRPGVKALDRASRAGIPGEVVDWSDFADRGGFTSAVCDAADRYQAETLVCAGFMRILAPEAIRRFPDRVINIHPALLPAFPGAHAVEEAMAYGVKVTGVTVHFVDEKVDHGPIIAQEAVAVEPGDTVESLHARIQEVEHRLYPAVVSSFAGGQFAVSDRIVTWKGPMA